MHVRNIHHVGIVVRDMDQAYRLWRDTIGLPVVKEGEERGLKLSLLRIGNSFIELLQPLTTDSDTAAFLERTGGGMDHLCLETTDVHADHATALERGLDVLWGGIDTVFTGDAFFLNRSNTQGILVELLQPELPTAIGTREDALFTEVTMINTHTADLLTAARQWEQNFDLQVESYLVAPEADNRHFMIPTGERGAAYIEVLTPLTPTGKNADYVRKVGDGLFQIDVRADDPDEAVRRLNAAGYRAMQTDGMDHGRTATFVHPKSAGGVFIAIFPPGPVPSGPLPW